MMTEMESCGSSVNARPSRRQDPKLPEHKSWVFPKSTVSRSLCQTLCITQFGDSVFMLFARQKPVINLIVASTGKHR